MKRITAVLATLLLLATACGSDTDTGTAAGKAVGEAIPKEAEPEPETEPVEEPEPEPEPEPEASHDWPSTTAYRLDLMDSAGDVAELLGLVGESAGLYGFMPDDDLAKLFDTAATVIRSHIDHFEGTTPPAEFAEAQGLLLEGWNLFEQAWTQTANGLRANDPSRAEDGLEMMERGIVKINEATAALP